AARRQALVEYQHSKVRDRYDADLMMAGFSDGFTECASRLPSDGDIEIAILGRTATQAAKAVHALIERGILGTDA
ncbi:hypothetical protein, partial [Leucobacter chromiisoli]|uniref:hypothetical protein n=1 Tax=Leucobacter chromiisoli TaxID=2796471 RepID=UPI001F1FF4B2